MKLITERAQAPIKKSSAIRDVVSKTSGLTNKQIRDEVKKRFGLVVFDNHVIQVAGSFAERTAQGGFPPHLMQKAKDFLRCCGGEYEHAKRVLGMAVLR